MMKVLAVTSLLPNAAEPGKGTFVVARIEAAARAADAEVRAVSPIPWFPRVPGPERWRRFAEVPDEGWAGSIPVRYVRSVVTPKIGTSLYAVWLASALERALSRERKRFAFDVIDAHYLYPDGAAAAMVARSLGVPLVLSARGSDLHSLRRHALLRPWLRFAIRRARRFIVVSRSLLGDVEALGLDPSRAHVIPNGVDFSCFQPIDRAAARSQLGVPAEGKMLLAVGRLHPVKNFPLLFDALSRLDKDVSLYVVGAGGEEAMLRALAARAETPGRIHFVGERTQRELAKWYSAADVFCLSSIREGCPNALLEALACGTPAVSTDVGDVREVITSDGIGTVVREPGSDAFADALRAALARAFDRSEVAAAVRGRSWDEVGRAVASEWRSAIAEGPRI
ncbi:MAG: glycosyltransferase [Planctomycetes bacterium]|nr:glycosyltransferase [Planctomycetota bacterium]MBI3843310.1 glycosyltransferase [Planctomycetota bacterium]